MKRAAALLVVIENAEQSIVKDRQIDLNPEEVNAILNEAVLNALHKLGWDRTP